MDFIAGFLLVLLGAALLAEAGLRLRLRLPPWPSANLLARRSAFIGIGTLNRCDSETGWSLKPNRRHLVLHRHTLIEDGLPRVVPRRIPYVTGAHGIRMNGPDIRPVRPGGILTVGSSFAVGSCVAGEESWPAILEQALGEPVLNGSCGGWALDQAVLHAERLIPLVRPRLLVLSMNTAGLEMVCLKSFNALGKPYFTCTEQGLALHNLPVDRTVPVAVAGPWRLLGRSALAVCAAGWLGRDPWLLAGLGSEPAESAVPEADGTAPWVAVCAGLLQRARDVCRARALPLVFFVQYEGQYVTGRPARRRDLVRFLARVRAAGVLVADPWDRIKDLHLRDPAGFEALFVERRPDGNYGHMTRAGNALMAEILAGTLADAGLVAGGSQARRAGSLASS